MLHSLKNPKNIEELKYSRKPCETNQIINFLKMDLKNNNTFSLDEIYVYNKKYLAKAQKCLQPLIDHNIKIKII